MAQLREVHSTPVAADDEDATLTATSSAMHYENGAGVISDPDNIDFKIQGNLSASHGGQMRSLFTTAVFMGLFGGDADTGSCDKAHHVDWLKGLMKGEAGEFEEWSDLRTFYGPKRK